MPLVVFKCKNDKCKNFDKEQEVLVKKVYDNAEEAASDAPTCTECGSKLEWKEWNKTSFKLNFTPFH